MWQTAFPQHLGFACERCVGVNLPSPTSFGDQLPTIFLANPPPSPTYDVSYLSLELTSHLMPPSFRAIAIYMYTCITTHMYRNTHVSQCTCITIHMYHNTHVSQYTCITTHMYHNARVSQCTCITIHMYHSTRVSQYTCIIVHMYFVD